MIRIRHGLLLVVSLATPAAAADLRLIEAAKAHDVRGLRALVESGVDVNEREPDGTTALHWAVLGDDVESFTLLLGAGARPGLSNDYGMTPLLLAAGNGSAAAIEALIGAGASARDALPSGETALMLASRTGREDAVRVLVARGADLDAAGTVMAQNALMWAAAEGHAPVVRLLVERGAGVSARSRTGFTALFFAARAGDVDSARTLLDAGTDVNEAAKDGTTPLLLAMMRGHLAVVELLLSRGANANASGTGYTALHWAAGNWETSLRFGDKAQDSEYHSLTGLKGERKLRMVRALLAAGADVNARTTRTPPRFGSSGGGADPYYYELESATPFLIAAMAGDAGTMRLLAAAGADALAPSSDGTTPVMQAAGNGRATGEANVPETDALEAVKVAVALGGEVRAINAYGDTALHGAAVHGYDAVVRFLAAQGATVDPVNRFGDTPWMVAAGRGARRAGVKITNVTTADVLRELGAREREQVPDAVVEALRDEFRKATDPRRRAPKGDK